MKILPVIAPSNLLGAITGRIYWEDLVFSNRGAKKHIAGGRVEDGMWAGVAVPSARGATRALRAAEVVRGSVVA